MSGVRVVRVAGDARARGRAIGRELDDLIERSLAFYRRYCERRGVDSTQLQDLLAPYLLAAEMRLPRMTATIKAMAEGAMVPAWELFAVNAFEELELLLEVPEGEALFLQREVGPGPRGATPPRSDRCSSFTVRAGGSTLLGHNEQWLAGDAGNVAVVIEAPTEDAPAIASPTVVCCLPAVGVNQWGAAQGIQSLVASDDAVGVPRVLVSRHTLDALDRPDATRRAAFAGRAGGYGYTFAFATGDAFLIETTANMVTVLEGTGPHTNHYLDPALGSLAARPSAGSVARYERMLQLIEEVQPDSPEDAMAILQDHGSAPQQICLHPDASQGEEAAAVVFSTVIEVERGRMWVAPGNPCETAYEEIDLRGVVGRA